MKRLSLLLSLLLLAAAPGTVLSQQRAGDFELQFYGTYFRTVGLDVVVGSGIIGGKIGPYITNRLQIGIGPSLTITTVTEPSYWYDPVTFETYQTEQTTTTTQFGTSAFLVYSFLSSGGKLVPYVGAQWYKDNFNQPLTEDAGMAGVNAGIKYFFARKTALDLSGNYLWNLNTESEGGAILIMFGLSFLF